MAGETVEEYLKRGGAIKKVPPSPTAHIKDKDRSNSHVQAQQIKRNR
jgi:hypothetical protein